MTIIIDRFSIPDLAACLRAETRPSRHDRNNNQPVCVVNIQFHEEGQTASDRGQIRMSRSWIEASTSPVRYPEDPTWNPARNILFGNVMNPSGGADERVVNLLTRNSFNNYDTTLQRSLYVYVELASANLVSGRASNLLFLNPAAADRNRRLVDNLLNDWVIDHQTDPVHQANTLALFDSLIDLNPEDSALFLSGIGSVLNTNRFYIDARSRLLQTDSNTPTLISRVERSWDVLDFIHNIREQVVLANGGVALTAVQNASLNRFLKRGMAHIYSGNPSAEVLRNEFLAFAVEHYTTWTRTVNGATIRPSMNMLSIFDSALQRIVTTRPYMQNGGVQRVANLRQMMQAAPLIEYFRYLAIPNPRQSIIDHLVQRFSQPSEAQAVIANLTHDTRIRNRGRLDAAWLRDPVRLREILQALVFNPSATATAQDAVTLSNRPFTPPQLNVSVPNLSTRLDALVALHPREAVEYRAAGLALMHALYGNGTPRYNLSFNMNARERFVLPLEVIGSQGQPDRHELVLMYEGVSAQLGATTGTNNILTGVEIGATVLGVGGSIARVGLGSDPSIGNFRAGEGDAALAATSALACAGGVPLILDGIRGFGRANRTTENFWAGLGGAVVCGVVGGFLPMAFDGDNPTPMGGGRNSNGRNPTTDYGP